MSETKDTAALPACPAETTLTLIGDKWKVLILRDLLPGKKKIRRIKKVCGKCFAKGADGSAARHGKKRTRSPRGLCRGAAES